MEFIKFKQTLDGIRLIDNFSNRLSEFRIEFIESDVYDSFYIGIANLFTEIYGKEGYEWITWYMYEQPQLLKMIEEKGDKKEYHAWDENGNPMDLSTDEKLWEMLEKEYAIGKKYHEN